jgi:D-erythrulose 1-phosphate 3-epimerase
MAEVEYPEIYLAIDNCFAKKRWTDPADWMRVIKELGIDYIEASADNECDPLYTTPDYIKDWVTQIEKNQERYGVKVANFYSGHGTYATLGLAHPDVRLRRHMLENWLKPMIRTASRLKAGLGFFFHAFPEAVLQEPSAYNRAEKDLYDILSRIAVFAAEEGIEYCGVEQMYSPNQIPWTIKGARKLLYEVYHHGGAPFYLTIDTGHQSGQRKFLRPSTEKIDEALNLYKSTHEKPDIWTGPLTSYRIFEQAANNELPQSQAVKMMEREMDRYPYLFAEYMDGDPYLWLEELGAYSPIIHLQQTPGNTSSHYPFTEEYNINGIINGQEVLKALIRSYKKKEEKGLPPRCRKIYLTLEIFSGTADISVNLLESLRQSVEYWRQYIPEDSLTLNLLVDKI